MEKIKVLLAIGPYSLCKALHDLIEEDAQLCIVAEVSNVYHARDKIIELDPDIMLLSDDIAGMTGIDFLTRLMPQHPLPTLMLGSARLEEKAYDAGAKDFIALQEQMSQLREMLLYEGVVLRIKEMINPAWNEHTQRNKKDTKKTDYENCIIAMGASTGGTEAMYQVIREFGSDIPGIVIVQHMPEGFTDIYAHRLNKDCTVVVKEAKSGDVVRIGQVLLAPGDRHMRVVKVNGMYQVECRKGPRVSGHCPSVDVLFESVARVAGKDSIGVLMTGMGADGATGLFKLHERGAATIAQDERTSVVYGMPKEAYKMGAVSYQLPLNEIAKKIMYLVNVKRRGLVQ